MKFGQVLLPPAFLLLVATLNLLVLLGYIPYAVLSLFTGAALGQVILKAWTQWTTIHQLLCLTGGFFWLAATISYTHRSGGACLYCGRRDGREGWQSPNHAARWGRMAGYVAMEVPAFYAFTRYAWALGIPLGTSEATLRQGQESGTWISGLCLATFGLVGAALILGLVQRWGEVFPSWMIGLAGCRVPIALAVALASIVRCCSWWAALQCGLIFPGFSCMLLLNIVNKNLVDRRASSLVFSSSTWQSSGCAAICRALVGDSASSRRSSTS